MTGGTRLGLWELKNFLRRRGWLTLTVFLLGTTLACGVAYLLPNVYEASTTIVVERQEFPEAYPGALLAPRLEERLRVAQIFLTSDTLIRRAILRLGLVADPGDAAATDEQVEAIREKLTVKVSGIDSFQLSLKGRNAEQITSIVNELASEFIRENVSYSARVMKKTSDFLAEEKTAIEARLQEHEAQIKSLREQTLSQAPEQLDAALRTIDRLQGRLDQVSRELREARDKVPVLERQLAVTSATSFSNETERATTTPLGRLQALQASLDSALAKYTEEHPEVQRLRREIREATTRLAVGQGSAGFAQIGDSTAGLGPYPNPAYVALAASLDLAKAAVKGLKVERSGVIAELRKYQSRVDLMPRRAQELAALTRDYEALKERQQLVLKKMLEADMSQKVEGRQSDENFRVLDPATLPTKPVRPQRVLIAFVGIVMAAALAIGVGWGADQLFDVSFHTAREAEERLGLPVLAIVAAIEPATERITR